MYIISKYTKFKLTKNDNLNNVLLSDKNVKLLTNIVNFLICIRILSPACKHVRFAHVE